MAQISPAMDAPPALQPAGRLVHEAVHRNRPLSREGLSERLFTLAFSAAWSIPRSGRIRRSIWRRWRSGRTSLVTIASGGCNVLTYLSPIPARDHRRRPQPAHVALTRLKLAGIRHLPAYADLLPLLRRGRRAANIAAFDHFIAPASRCRDRAYWDGAASAAAGASRCFSANIYRRGLLGRFIGAGHRSARLYGVDPRGMIKARNVARAARTSSTSSSRRSSTSRCVRWLTSQQGLAFRPRHPAGAISRAGSDRRRRHRRRAARAAGAARLRFPASRTIISPGRPSAARYAAAAMVRCRPICDAGNFAASGQAGSRRRPAMLDLPSR